MSEWIYYLALYIVAFLNGVFLVIIIYDLMRKKKSNVDPDYEEAWLYLPLELLDKNLPKQVTLNIAHRRGENAEDESRDKDKRDK